MPDEQVAVIVKFFAKPSVAAVKVTSGEIAIGNKLKFVGHTTDFEQKVESMQIENQPVERAVPGDLVGIKVGERVRQKDKVFKIVED